jgi:hypothetical protein
VADGERAQEALDHLQTAALELIAAFRAVLDVAEEAVREPQALRDLITTTARAATHAASQAAGGSPGGSSSGFPAGEGAGEGHNRASTTGVEHISIT